MESPIDRSSVYEQGMSKTGAEIVHAKVGFWRDCRTDKARSGDVAAQTRKADSETVDVVDSERLLDMSQLRPYMIPASCSSFL